MFSTADIFSDHMVLRHSRKNPVWGIAPAGEEITVKLGDCSETCAADSDGKWQVWIDTPAAGKTICMEIFCQNEIIRFSDIACGEVWLAGGQSNMEQPLMNMLGAKKWAEAAASSNVRIKKIPRRCSEKRYAGWHFYPTESNDEPWTVATSDSACKTSAIGFVFVAMLAKKLEMPVGLIECNWGGTPIQSWISMECIQQHNDTQHDLLRFYEAGRKLGDKALSSVEEYQRTVRQAMLNDPDFVSHNLEDPLSFLKEDRGIAFVPFGARGCPEQPGSLFEHMVKRVAPYGLSGVLWYQGEANAENGEAQRYSELFGRLLDCWRNLWKDSSMPFLTCQLAGFDASLYWKTPNWECLREQQKVCSQKYANVSMAVLMDLGMEKNIHPLYKEPVAERLYRLALSDVYGIECSSHSPYLKEFIRKKEGFSLHFSAAIEIRDGLLPYATDVSGKCLKGELERIAHDTLFLKTGTETPHVTSICYAQQAWTVPGLFGTNGLPAEPFRYVIG